MEVNGRTLSMVPTVVASSSTSTRALLPFSERTPSFATMTNRINSDRLFFGSSRTSGCILSQFSSQHDLILDSRYQPTPAASATLCFPSFTLWDVNVKVDLGSGNITKVTQLQPFSSSSNFSSLSANVTGAPLNGRAYNGIQFNLTDPDPFVLARRNATQLQMPAAVYQSAVQSPEGLVGSFEADRFVRLSTNVYVSASLILVEEWLNRSMM